MGMKLYKNGVTDEDGRWKMYKLFATCGGIRAIPTSELSDKRLLLPYEDLDHSITNEEKVTNKVNEFLLNKTGEKCQNLLTWKFEKDPAFSKLQRVLRRNQLLEHEFDSE